MDSRLHTLIQTSKKVMQELGQIKQSKEKKNPMDNMRHEVCGSTLFEPTSQEEEKRSTICSKDYNAHV